MDAPLWKATVTYRTQLGPLEVEHDLDQLMDLDSLIERGPHFETIIEIKIVPARHFEKANLTVKEAEKL